MLYRVGCIFTILLFFAVGCESPDSSQLTKVESSESDVDQSTDTLYFWADIAPIIEEHCTACHNQDGSAPFAFHKFEDLKRRTKTIRYVVSSKIMPPWPADPTFSRFKDEKFLPEAKREKLVRWIDQGALEGELTTNQELRAQPVSPELAQPDFVIKFPDTVFIAGDSRDRFMLTKLAFELPRDTIVRAIEFVPGNRQLVHHVNGHMVNYADRQKTNPMNGKWMLDAEKVPSLEAYELMEVANDDGSYPALRVSAFNYLPGVEPAVYPDNLGNLYLNKKGAFILNTLHYGPSAKDTFDLSEIRLYFDDQKPKRTLEELQMGTLGVTKVEPEFVIYADSISSFSTSYTVPKDISVLTINPHMHLLGKEFIAYAISPAQDDTIPLISIPNWDFRWQYFYTYETMLHIPKGYTIKVLATFDNTIDNPLNPNFPPETLYEGGEHMKTTDEMFQFFITFTNYQEGDENIKL